MAKLLQLVKTESKKGKIKVKESDILKINKKIIDMHKESKSLIGDVPEHTEKIMRRIISNLYGRESYWANNRCLPSSLMKVDTSFGEVSDNYTAIASLPQVKLSNLRTLANKLNMVIIPIDYTDIKELFKTQKNKDSLYKQFDYFRSMLIRDNTTNYQMYILCPIDYYNIWEQIKSDNVKDIYFSNYFDMVATTLELMIPAQKNIYLATKTNTENIESIAKTFNANIENLNKKIKNISVKIDELEKEFIAEKLKTQKEIENLKSQNEKLEADLQKSKIKMQEEISFSYGNLDPILFAIPENLSVVNDEYDAIIGLCWGEDIDDNYLELKGLEINNKNILKLANPINTICNLNILNYTYLTKLNIEKMIKNMFINKIYDKISNDYENCYRGRNIDNVFRFKLFNDLDLYLNFKYEEYDKEEDEQLLLKNVELCFNDEILSNIENEIYYASDRRNLLESSTKFVSVESYFISKIINHVDTFIMDEIKLAFPSM